MIIIFSQNYTRLMKELKVYEKSLGRHRSDIIENSWTPNESLGRVYY